MNVVSLCCHHALHRVCGVVTYIDNFVSVCPPLVTVFDSASSLADPCADCRCQCLYLHYVQQQGIFLQERKLTFPSYVIVTDAGK